MKLPLTHLQLALIVLVSACSGGSAGPGTPTPPPVSGLHKINHIIIVMMENHSFDNYFGVLAYAPGSLYHVTPGGCSDQDHGCVDGLICRMDSVSGLTCTNSNQETTGIPVMAFHNASRCVADLAHAWPQVHQEANFNDPNAALLSSPSDGFVRVNDALTQLDNGIETPTEDQTMGFYTQDDLPFYYDVAQKFAIDDRYFSSVLGPTLPNRSYLAAATSFGHVATGDSAPAGGYKPITGTIFDLLESRQITWADYFQLVPQAGAFRPNTDPHFFPVQNFMTVAAGSSGAAPLPQVAFVDPSFGGPDENDEHPPTDIQRGQAFVSRVINAVRNGPYWKDSVIFVTYDEHGGFYDHVAPPQAPQGASRTPDGIFPGQCADLSNPPASQQPGAGANCASVSVPDAESLCPALVQNARGPYPENCASFDQLGFRVPFMVVSPFAKPHYVSHTIADHTSLLAFIEARFLSDVAPGTGTGSQHYLTARDQYANPLLDLFDFDNAPSLNTSASQAGLPAIDCTPIH